MFSWHSLAELALFYRRTRLVADTASWRRRQQQHCTRQPLVRLPPGGKGEPSIVGVSGRVHARRVLYRSGTGWTFLYTPLCPCRCTRATLSCLVDATRFLVWNAPKFWGKNVLELLVGIPSLQQYAIECLVKITSTCITLPGVIYGVFRCAVNY